jgi:hypothetical protein
MKTKVLHLAFLFLMLISSSCLANPIVVYQFPSFGGEFVLNPGLALAIDFVSDLVVLVLAYLVLRNIRILYTWRFLPYLGTVYVGGIIIDSISVVPVAILGFVLPGEVLNRLLVFICAGLLLYFYNYFLAKRFIKLDKNQARVVGIIMAILTNPVVGGLLVGMYRDWRYS